MCMCVCMYVYIYICSYVCTYIYIYIYIFSVYRCINRGRCICIGKEDTGIEYVYIQWKYRCIGIQSLAHACVSTGSYVSTVNPKTLEAALRTFSARIP